MTARPLFFLLLALAVAAPARAVQSRAPYPYHEAPDGHRGFGAEPEPRDVERLFRSVHEDDVDFLTEVTGLEREVLVLVQLARAYNERRGYYELLGVDGDSDELLVQRFQETLRNPFSVPLSEPKARAFARLLGDSRFRVRADVLVGFEEDARQLRGGIALFQAHTFGLADLTGDGELARIAQRVDLAAARIRALRLDLEALYQSPAIADEAEDDLEIDFLVQALIEGDASGQAQVRRIDRMASVDATRMQAGLFTPRLARDLSRELAERERAVNRAREVYVEVLRLLPHLTGETPEADIARMDLSERYRRAASAAIEGLWNDPFHDELSYMAGLAQDFFAGRSLSRPYFDRFLALHGIRYYDHRTYQGRDLNAREEYALLVVANWRPPKSRDD